MRRTRTIKNFDKLSNNQQISELVERHEDVKKEFKLYFNFLQHKFLTDLPDEEQKNILENEKHNKLCAIYNNFFNEMAELTQYMGQYENV